MSDWAKTRVTRLGEISPFGQFFMALGKILAMKKSPKIDLNKAKILFQKRFFYMFFKNFQKILSPFLCKKKTIKECPVPLDISIKSNRTHHKTVLYSKSKKTWLGNFLGDFSLSLGNFLTKTSGHPGLNTSPSVSD